MNSPLQRALIAPIRLYQWCLSPLLPGACRYEPSCSAYAAEAIATQGAFRGLWLAMRRLSRCHPWGGSGYDPVPHVAESSCHRAAHERCHKSA